MTTLGKLVVTLIVIVIIAIAAVVYFVHKAGEYAASANTQATTTPQTYGMAEYTDEAYGFTFWYPQSIAITVSTSSNSASFPGGTDVEQINVGPQGGTQVSVVESTSSTITDEPNDHASPIPQTKYFYDVSTAQWMIAHPEGTDESGSAATTTADTSKTTVGGLFMLPAGARFDTTIIPLSTTEFLVVQDGGGSSFTSELAATVAPSGASVDPAALSSALQAEAAAYANANQ